MGAAVQAVREAPASSPVETVDHPAETFGWLPCRLSLEIPVTKFTVGDLLRLGKGAIVETACRSNSDIPLLVNGLLICWTEFEVVGNRLAVRITELA